MANSGFKCIYLICVDHNNDVNHVIGRNPSLKRARTLASNARTKWPDKDIYISVEKILENPMISENDSLPELSQPYPMEEEDTTSDTEELRNPEAICICGKLSGECVGLLDCRCNALAKCKNLDFNRDNPFDTNPGWGLSSELPKNMYRTLIRVEGFRRGIIDTVIPGWDPEQTVSISANELPSEALAKIKEGYKYFYAKVNLDAENVDDLVIEFLEMGPKQAPTNEEVFGEEFAHLDDEDEDIPWSEEEAEAWEDEDDSEEYEDEDDDDFDEETENFVESDEDEYEDSE